MRTVTYGAACSLDLYITGPGGALDWLVWSADAQAVMGEFWPTVDTILMGRKTYEVALQNGSADGANDSGVKTYVFSRTLKEAKGATIISEGAGAFVRALKAQPGKGICVMGGGELAQSLFAADVIDEFGLNIHPLLLGGGTPLIPPVGRRVALELVSTKGIEGGCILANYRVKRG